jgi:2-polyprenyl-6-methoxyphenol hydroxylase-like FAD-dependent oxidoreductase
MVDTKAATSGNERMKRAVVIGGSIAGSLAAAALADHFAEVVVLDRDHLPEQPEQRKAVPQGYHYHALLGGGRERMNQLLPGFKKELVRQGAPSVAVTSEILMRLRCGWAPRFESDVVTIMASRPLIEFAVRKLAREIPNVEYRTGKTVYGLTTQDGRADGVRVRDLESRAESVLAADLVVDTSGRSAKTFDWLKELGYPVPSEVNVDARWGYASVFARVPENWDPGFRAVHAQPLGDGFAEGHAGTRGCSMWVQEGERRWIFTVQGAAGDYPPRDENALRAYVNTIGIPEVDQALEQFEFMGPVQIWRSTVSRRRDYANLERRLENFILMGDSVAAFNPVYGQGMTVSALAGVALSEELTQHRAEHGNDLLGFAERFQRRLDQAVAYCWASSTQQDFGIPGVEVKVDGVRQEPPKAEMEYTDRLTAYITRNPELWVKWLESTHLLRPGDWLESDEIVSAVKANWDELGEAVPAFRRELAE